MPFVGTVPAIKPACAASQSKRVSVLGTEATVAREYTHALIRSFGEGCDVTLVGSGGLAHARRGGARRSRRSSDAAIRAEIAPCFVPDGAERTDTVVLACTHYPLLLDRFERLAPWPVRWIDPAPAIARRVVELVGPSTGTNSRRAGARVLHLGPRALDRSRRRAHALRIEVRTARGFGLTRFLLSVNRASGGLTAVTREAKFRNFTAS